ncbi:MULTISPECIES: hypothetical protein [Pectobacteriaceae]|uniref:Uncharacterized protein n=1 Tax=Musicola paradisiaca (strain Ech703) TaxID=579405 RepID=C6C5F9_MUSP7|nr:MULTISPECIES: hypothetical protein [Pectobacteriaceae]ACS87596.1 hypothetical protein Dd703_3843 [Musicola paradisiaca Ech703]QWT42579.1 hypothetical protein KNV89_08960 [Dickeya dadantii]
MQKPISIAPFLWQQQTESRIKPEIRHGEGKQGIIIRPDGRRWNPPKGAFNR